MKIVETAMTTSHFIRRRSPHFQLVGLVAVCLLGASTNDVWAQICVCAEPGWMNCSLMGFSSHEPATAAFPQCQVRSRRAAPPPPRQKQPGRAAVNPPRPAVVNPPPAPTFDARRQFQIQPLNCPLHGFVRVGTTFYGGAQCAPPMGMPAAVVQHLTPPPAPSRGYLPAQPPAQASKPQGPPPAASKSDEITPKQPSEPAQNAVDQTGNAEADKRRAESNWGSILDYFKGRKTEKNISSDTGAGLFRHPSENFPLGHDVVWPR